MTTENFGRYRIVAELGRGTMGVVYKAHDPQIDRMVALKVLRPDRVTSEFFVARFLKEARAIGRLSDPHIVTIYDVGEDHGTVFIAMELLKGEPFDEVIRSGRLTVRQSVRIARQAALTLDYAHRQGIVHRDVKPSNIILAEGDQVKLTDFGIARIEDANAGLQTQAGEILGTPVYMSPEQVKGEKADGRSDLFSLGVILYEMVAGRRPFGGGSLAAIFRAISQDAPENPSQANPSIPALLSRVILKSLAKSPAERFQTGAEFAQALAAVVPEEPAGGSSGRGPRSERKVGKAAAWLALPLIVVLAAAGYIVLQFRPPGPTPPAGIGSPASGDKPAGLAAVPSAPPPSAPEAQGLLKISSDPQGAQIFVDHGYQGMTPMGLPLALGKHEVRLNLPGYLEWEAQVSLTEGETPLHVSLRPLE